MPDMAHAVALAARSGTAQSKVYNLGELKTPTIIERISHLATVFDWEGKLTSLPDAELPDYLITPGDFEQDLEFDSSKIRAEQVGLTVALPANDEFSVTVRNRERKPKDRNFLGPPV